MSAVLYSSADRIGVITLNRPEARNAVDREMALGLEAAVDRLEDDPEVRVGVLCANTEGQALFASLGFRSTMIEMTRG